MKRNPVPIFVLGKQRSGTTWLANKLSQHPEIVAIKHEIHQGVHESVYFSHLYGRFGDLRKKTNYENFVKVFGNSDYARLAGVNIKDLLERWPTTYGSLFRTIMDEFAIRNKASYWLEKSPDHTPHLRLLERLYPDALFIGIKRDTVDVIASTLRDSLNDEVFYTWYRRKRLIIINVLLQVFFNKIMTGFSSKSRKMILINFSDLKSNPNTNFRRICQFLKIPYSPAIEENQFEINSSFKSKYERRNTLTPFEKKMIISIASTVQIVPVFFIHLLFKIFRKRKYHQLPKWFFKLQGK